MGYIPTVDDAISLMERLSKDARLYNDGVERLNKALKSIKYRPEVYDSPFSAVESLVRDYQTLRKDLGNAKSSVVYKLVMNRSGEDNPLSSINDNIVGSKWEVFYEPNIVTRPSIENTKLYCFETKASAVHFAKVEYCSEHLQLWIAEATNVERVERIARPGQGSISCFWESIFAKYEFISSQTIAPEGTLSCDSIKLIERLSL